VISPDTPAYRNDERATALTLGPFPGSRKIHVRGSRLDVRVPMRMIAQSDTVEADGARPNSGIPVYDTSGPYTDPDAVIDPRRGLPPIRTGWIEERGDTEPAERRPPATHHFRFRPLAI